MAASPFAVVPAASSTRQIWRFGLLCVAFAALWFIGSAYGLGVSSPLDMVLCHQLAAASAWGLRALGWAASVDAVRPDLLVLNGQPSVRVGPQCDGLVLYALLAGFVLAYPGPPRRRLWFVPMGIVALWLLNIVRIIALSLNFQYSPETFDFDHHYAFNAVAYAALGGFWLLWTRQTSAAAPATGWPMAAKQAATPAASRPWLTPRVVAGVALLLLLTLVTIYQTQVTAALSASWAAALTHGPAWLHRLPGATASNVPNTVSHLALPVGATYLAIILGIALLAMRLLLPDHDWRTVWRCYVGLGLAYVLFIGAGRVSNSVTIYRLGRMVLDFMTSLLPVAGLLVLLWRPLPAKTALAVPAD
ncbi:MAG: exosortase X [Janthinobacterium lividum]